MFPDWFLYGGNIGREGIKYWFLKARYSAN